MSRQGAPLAVLVARLERELVGARVTLPPEAGANAPRKHIENAADIAAQIREAL